MQLAATRNDNFGADALSRFQKRIPPLLIYWAVFAISLLAFVLNFFIGQLAPALGGTLTVASLVTCGFAWLLARALFRGEHDVEIWPISIVAWLFVISVALYFSGGDTAHGVMGYLATMHGVIGSAMLMMVVVEPLNGSGLSRAERRFRAFFIGGYVSIVLASFALRLPELAELKRAGQVILACLGLIGASGAVWFRNRHPITLHRKRSVSRAQNLLTNSNPVLAERLHRLIAEEKIYLKADLKVEDLARRVGQPAYRISQCIVTDLGFDNFNQMINTHRVNEACRRLCAEEFADQSILVIALDSGFASIGPFNRAFKKITSKTPSEFRRCPPDMLQSL